MLPEDELLESFDDEALPKSLLGLLGVLFVSPAEEVPDDFSDVLSVDEALLDVEGALGAVLSFTERADSFVAVDDVDSAGSENASSTLVPATPSAIAPMPAATPTQVPMAARRCGS